VGQGILKFREGGDWIEPSELPDSVRICTLAATIRLDQAVSVLGEKQEEDYRPERYSVPAEDDEGVRLDVAQ
jgi:hypothetical protein